MSETTKALDAQVAADAAAAEEARPSRLRQLVATPIMATLGRRRRVGNYYIDRSAVAEDDRNEWTANDAGCRSGVRALRGRK